MEFKTHNDKPIDSSFTGLVGTIDIDYATLKKTFGLPNDGDGYKTDAEWEILFEDGKVATIYNYKTGRKYQGVNGTPKTKITHWNIGGHDASVVLMVKQILGIK